MGIFGILLMVVGGIVGCVGGIWLLVVAFQQHILWGLGSLFVPFVSLIFAIMYWSVAKRPFLISLLGSAVVLVGAVLMALGAPAPAQM